MSSYKPITNVLDFNVALKPSKAFPLDPRTMFGSFAEAQAAAATAEDAGSDKTIYYFGQTVTVYENGVAKSYLIQPDDSGKGTLVEQSAVASWNDLKDRPFGEEVYEDSYDFAVTPTVYFDALGNRFYKISDIALSYEQLLQTSFTVVSGETSESFIPTAEQFLFNSADVAGFAAGDIGIGVAYTTGEIATDYGTLNVPETGTYIGFPEGDVPSDGTAASFHYEGVKTIDEKYLPESVGDMQASVYDPQGRAQDVFAYIDKMVNVSESIAFVVYIDLVSNTADTSLDSIFDEINLNKSIYAKIENDDEVKYTLFPLVSYSGGGFVDGTSYPAEAKFSAVFSDDTQGTAYTRVITLTEGDDLAHPDVSVADYPQAEGLPTVTEDDNGKFLQVVGGAWGAVTILNGNEVAW